MLQKDGSLIEMGPRDYDSEDILQELLAKYPNLLAGEQIDELNPRRWILVSREISIPDDTDAEGRWSLDHLFLDQDGVPTLVEVKRSTDTRIRREVVGQMLDYAANAASYWDVDKIMSHYEANCERSGLDPKQNWIERLQLEENYDDYWGKVSQNLETGRLRMLFVADEIPFELKRVVEFLNEQMKPAEVLALEIKQYVSENHKTLIPRVFGQSSKTQTMKSSGRSVKRQWDEPTFLSEMSNRQGSEALRTTKLIFDWAKSRDLNVWFGSGGLTGSYLPTLDLKGKWFSFFALLTNGNIELQFQVLKNRPIYGELEKRKRLYDELGKIPGISLPTDGYNRCPKIPLSVLYREESLNLFLEIWTNCITEIRNNF